MEYNPFVMDYLGFFMIQDTYSEMVLLEDMSSILVLRRVRGDSKVIAISLPVKAAMEYCQNLPLEAGKF